MHAVATMTECTAADVAFLFLNTVFKLHGAVWVFTSFPGRARPQHGTSRPHAGALSLHMSQDMLAWWRGDTLLFRQHGEVRRHDDASHSDQHTS